MKVIIVGAGIGGLICAIACRREKLDVVVLERTPALSPIGAGIQIPPNAIRVAKQLGILPKLAEKSVVLDSIDYLRYADGKLLFRLDGGEEMERKFGEKWMVILRSDYHSTLWNAAKDAGVDLRLGCEMESIDATQSVVRLVGGETVQGDVIVGADGLWSVARGCLLGRDAQPAETGDLAYRATIPVDKLLALDDPAINELIQRKKATCWMGPGRHCVMYPVAGGKKLNLVLIRPDNLEKNVRQTVGDLEEMRASFEGWDNRLTQMISCIPSVLKWKLCDIVELDKWSKQNVTLLGDACHPTLPYQAQGAAMAAEDGAVLGKLLGLLHRSGFHVAESTGLISEVLQLYENLRKARTNVNVRGATSNQEAYHMPNGPLQEARDAWLLSKTAAPHVSGLTFADSGYLTAMLAFDPVAECVEAFRAWKKGRQEFMNSKL